ncbi:MAG: glycosyltransferase [bacterium]
MDIRCPKLCELPVPPSGKSGWPWIEEFPQLPDKLPDGSAWPCISIVTPSFNRVNCLEETIRSVLLQGYPRLEFIIIDGGSLDGTLDIIKKYSRWILFWESRGDRGWPHAVNKGFRRCTGKLVTFFGSDDCYLPGTFNDVAINWSKKRDYGLFAGGFYYMDGESKRRCADIPCRLPNLGPLDLTLIPLEEWRIHQVATFYTAHALDDIGRYLNEELFHTADRELLYRICRYYKVNLSKRVYSAFRFHADNISNMHKFRLLEEYANLQLMFCNKRDTKDHIRKKIRKIRMSKAYLNKAKFCKGWNSTIIPLLIAVLYRPSIVFSRQFYKIVLQAFRLYPVNSIASGKCHGIC